MYHLEYLMRDRQKEILREVARYRLLAQAQQGPPRRKHLYALVLNYLGTRLSKWGSILQERFGDAEMVLPPKDAKNYI